jgi:uridine nucleosidase
MPLPILLDTDPGIDDAMALLLALTSPELELLAVTTVFGNAAVEQTTQNALRILEVGGCTDIPVAMGAGRPLVRALEASDPSIHGSDGLGGAFLGAPPPVGWPIETPAPRLIAETVMERPGEITLVAIGPLTNLALAARLEPKIVRAVKQVIIMGGAAFRMGNASPVAESNIHDDPEAAAIVFSAGWPLVMVGLDVTLRVLMREDYLAELAAGGTPQADFIAKLLPVYQRFYRRRFEVDHDVWPYREEGLPTHDPSAIAYAIDPTLFRTRRLPVWVETDGRCAGQTIPDPHRFWGDGPEVEVCQEVDAPHLLALFKERLAPGRS